MNEHFIGWRALNPVYKVVIEVERYEEKSAWGWQEIGALIMAGVVAFIYWNEYLAPLFK